MAARGGVRLLWMRHQFLNMVTKIRKYKCANPLTFSPLGKGSGEGGKTQGHTCVFQRHFPTLFDPKQNWRDLVGVGDLEIISEKNGRRQTEYEVESGRTGRNNQQQTSSWGVRVESEERALLYEPS